MALFVGNFLNSGAICKIKGEEIIEDIDVEINLSVSAYISSDYISDEITKLEMYKKIATIDSKEDMYEMQEELEDRFSDIPKETQALLNVAYIKSLCKRLKIDKVKQTGKIIDLQPLTKYETREVNGYDIVMELEDMLEGIYKRQKSREEK